MSTINECLIIAIVRIQGVVNCMLEYNSLSFHEAVILLVIQLMSNMRYEVVNEWYDHAEGRRVV